MSTTAGLISFKAREGKGAEVAERIAAALPHVNAEEGTTHWLVIRSEVQTQENSICPVKQLNKYSLPYPLCWQKSHTFILRF